MYIMNTIKSIDKYINCINYDDIEHIIIEKTSKVHNYDDIVKFNNLKIVNIYTCIIEYQNINIISHLCDTVPYINCHFIMFNGACDMHIKIIKNNDFSLHVIIWFESQHDFAPCKNMLNKIINKITRITISLGIFSYFYDISNLPISLIKIKLFVWINNTIINVEQFMKHIKIPYGCQLKIKKMDTQYDIMFLSNYCMQNNK